ncbi:glycosyltransferase family 2 protein [Pragia fontium]|uniref:glycosyltransferase family 2 protein n=1 Tax=Pragia fontium TaxID=82985 RepID=UPI000649D78E|nr:glycosyltransferase family 2 protein [Pragia fontium]AKJ40700.1 acyltransferase [Pragia fontium]
MPLNHSTDKAFNPCLVIPCYNHGSTMDSVLQQLAAFQLNCIVVDDGSRKETADELDRLTTVYSWITLVRHRQNQGKGGAVLSALREAQRQGYSHGVQVDADGQHFLDDIPRLLAEAQQYPDDIISGQPVYDESVPKSRLYSRYITHIWVWIETLSLSIRDSMCGFRVYPIDVTLQLADRVPLGQHMDFDTEIMVRLYWQGTQSRFIPTKVIYPEDGLSHFDVWRDNLRISWMHTRLFLAMLPRMPSLIMRHFKDETHWSQTHERKGLWGIRLMVKTYRLFGRRAFNLLLYPVIGFYWLTGNRQRQASEHYLQRLKNYAADQKLTLPAHLTSYRHFMRFGEAMLDKLACWLGDIKLDQVDFPDKGQCLQQLERQQGTLILGSHLGDLEVCRALGELSFDVKINALVFTQHAARFNQVMQEINPDSNINMIQVSSWGPEVAILLKQKLDNGEWVAIVGDRTSISNHHRQNEQRIIWADFLGKPAPFPLGPFVLASVLRCPVYLMFGLKPDGKFRIHFEKFADPLILPRENRQQAIQQTVERYASRLEHYSLTSPLDWFNFYDFWQLSKPEEQPSDTHES